MQLTRPPSKPVDQAFALIVTIVMLAVSLVVFAGIFSWAGSNAKMTERNNQYTRSQYAAESALERVIGQIDRDFISANISNANAYATLPMTIDQSDWPIKYMYSDTNGSTGRVSVVFAPASSTIVPLNSQYSGLSGSYQNVDVYATATPLDQMYNVPATLHESLQYAYIPLFQFAIFYNVNLEIDPGQAMTITGPVFCNQSIWEGSSVCTFASSVTAAGTNAPQVPNPFALNYNGSGPSIFAGGQPQSTATPLVMPIGTNNSPGAILGLLNLPPPPFNMGTAAAYSSNGMAYPANGADLVITNFAFGTNDGIYTPAGTNFSVYFQDNSLVKLPYDFYTLKTGGTTNSVILNNAAGLGAASNVLYAGFTWITNIVFYDWREGWNGGSGPPKRVEAVQIDMNLLNKWLTNRSVVNNGYTVDHTKLTHSGHHIGSVYIYNSVPLTTSQLPAVRVVNGAALPDPEGQHFGFTVATPFPLYVWGHYNCQSYSGSAIGSTNTANTLPAALMGDSITILSGNWNDGDKSKMVVPTSTTVNAAMLEGIVQSNPNISGDYSGGVENFMRLLENWSGRTLTYNGSIVVLFYSQYATNRWRQTGNYYNPPTRNWAFDMNFKSANKLPPLTPSSKAMIRGSWAIQ